MLLSILAKISADTYKVDAIRDYDGLISLSDVPAIISSVRADTYKVDALNELLSKGCFDPRDAFMAIWTIHADTYIVDAINAIASHHPRFPASIALQLFNLVHTDTFKVDSLDSLVPSFESNQVVTIIRNIKADTYRLDALRKLVNKVDSKDVMTLLPLFSKAYQLEATQVLQSLVRDEDVVAFTSIVEQAKRNEEHPLGVYIDGGIRNVAIGNIIENRVDDGFMYSMMMEAQSNPNEQMHLFGAEAPIPSLHDVYQNWRHEVEAKPDLLPKDPVKRFEYPNKLDDDIKVKDDDDKDVCAVCADYYHRTINLPCMHACLCFHCAKVIGESEKKLCPVCRTPLEAIKTVFKS